MSDARDRLLTVLARARFANLTLTMVVVGINVFMSLYGLSAFLETPAPLRKGRRRYIATSFAITTLFSLGASLDMANFFQTLFDSASPMEWRQLLVLSVSHWKYRMSYILAGLFIALGDALLVYRCYIICVEYRWVTILPALATMAGLGLFIASAVLADNLISYRVAAASTLLTVSTNIIVTSLITFHLLRARRNLGKVLPSADMRVYTGVIAILVESAAPLTILGIIAAILQQLNTGTARSPGFYVTPRYLHAFTDEFTKALSPHMIIFRVTTGRSFTKFPTPKDGVLSNPIQFARQPAESSLLSALNTEPLRDADIDAERGRTASG
ncbi:hypothetical protein MD484_g2449, partial [Candolleomyces efflorescens]